MEKRRVLLLRSQHLLGESLERILDGLEDVQVVGVRPLDMSAATPLPENPPDLLLIADEEPSGELVTTLTVRYLEAFPNLPIVRVKLDRSILQLYTSQTLPARVTDLVEIIRHIPISELGMKDHPS